LSHKSPNPDFTFMTKLDTLHTLENNTAKSKLMNTLVKGNKDGLTTVLIGGH